MDRLPITAKIFVAPLIIICMMMGIIAISDYALQRQQTAFLEVVGGSIGTSQSTTKLLLSMAGIQSEVLRYVQLSQRVGAGDKLLQDLKSSIISRYSTAEGLFEQLKKSASPNLVDAISNISDFMTIHRAVAAKMLSGNTSTVDVSTLLAHYDQLQSYILELATRSLEAAEATEQTTGSFIRSFRWYLLLGSTCIVLAAVLITLFVGRAISVTVKKLSAALTSIAEGNSSVAIPGMQRRDEIGAMARAISVFASVTRELRDRERSLVEAREQAESANRTKSAFLASMSHELRTPLNAILGYTELILDDTYGKPPDKMHAVLERVQSNGKHLLGLINDVLDLSKIEAGQLALSLDNYSLPDLIQSVSVALEPLASQKKLLLRTNCEPNMPTGYGDERRLSQVLLNLVGNAIKFTDAGEVAIQAWHRDGRFAISVRDTGPGIAAADQAKIFDEFQQVDSSSTRKKGGTGLGLTISRRIVAMHGGDINVTSDTGKGATFTITLPIHVHRQEMAA